MLETKKKTERKNALKKIFKFSKEIHIYSQDSEAKNNGKHKQKTLSFTCIGNLN